MKDITVLLTACGVQFILGLISCLKDNGERNIRLIGTDMNDDKTLYSLFDKFYVVPKVNDLNYLPTLINICKQEKVDILLPFMSEELLLLADGIDKFNAIGTKVSIATKQSVEITNNKLKFYNFLKKQHLDVPLFHIISHVDELKLACEYVGYPKKPVCIKATKLSGSRGVRIIDPKKSRYDVLFNEKPNSFYISFDELKNTLKEVPVIPEMMAMEFLPGVEGSIDLIAEKGEILYMAYRESTVNLASIPQEAILLENQEAFEIAEKVMRALKFTGSADLDFKYNSENKPVLMEVNPRIAATMQIFKEGGLNLPYLRVKQLLNEELPEITNIRYGLKMKRRYFEMFTE